MLHLANPNLGPPGSFKARCPDLATKDATIANIGPFHSFRDLEHEWNKRRTANGFASLTDAQIQDRLCQHLPPGYCRDELNQPTIDPGAGALTLADAARGTATLITWWRNGRRRVDDNSIIKRSYICNQCPLHIPVHGCQGCAGSGLRSLINEIVGGRTLPTDHMLQACGVCKCSLVAKTRMTTEDALSHMSDAQKKALWEKCWLREGDANLSPSANP